MPHIHKKEYAHIAALLGCLGPSLFFLLAGNYGYEKVVELQILIVVLFLTLEFASFLRDITNKRAARMVVSVLSGAIVTLAHFLLMYREFGHEPFSLEFTFGSQINPVRSAWALMGSTYFFGTLSILSINFMCSYLYVSSAHASLFQKLLHAQHRGILRFGIAVLCATFFFSNNIKFLHAELISSDAGTDLVTMTPFTIPNHSNLSTASDENVIILQLESVNATMVEGLAEKNGKRHSPTYTPQLHRIARDGVYLPFFISGARITARAQAAILCGVSGYIGKVLSMVPERLINDCLPDILQKSGYETILYRSDRLAFMNTGNFMESIGMKHVLNKSIMREGDKRYSWGYDDCTFYRRAFEDLETRGDDKPFFAYFEVSSHHYPFNAKNEYADIMPIKNADGFTDNYINSLAVQDHCIGTFYEQFMKFDPENTHLIITGDHVHPIPDNSMFGKKYNSDDHGAIHKFTVPFVYIPPFDRREEFDVGSRYEGAHFSQADFIPTLLSILNDERYERSFDAVLRDTSARLEPPCTMTTKQFGSNTSVVLDWPLMYAHFERRNDGNNVVMITNAYEDLTGEDARKIETDFPLPEFMQRYGCKDDRSAVGIK